MAATTDIVTVNAQVTPAPEPSLLQQSGALVSVGGTTLTTGTYLYCSDLAAVTAVLSALGNYAELTKMATTYFAQGSAVGVYILELGVQAAVADGISALQTWITTTPNQFYAYLCPASWDGVGATLNTMAANYSSPTGRTYFFVTTTAATMAAYVSTTKAIFALVPSPTAASTEFQCAAPFYAFLANDPNVGSPAAPMAYRYLYGVTPWVENGNATSIGTILTAFVNIIGTGAEGGISTAILFKGTTMDGNQLMAWYAIDWVQIQAKQQLAAAIINGSNSNPPLYYSQAGINALLAVLTGIGSDAVSSGLLASQVPSTSLPNGSPAFTAVSFATYTTQNPTAYAAGSYGGFSATVTAQNGFLTITFNLDAVSF